MATGARAVLQDAEEHMKKAIDVLHQTLASVRGGRAVPGMVENLRVDYYGVPTPLKQLAHITVPEPKTLVIQPWDASCLKAVEKAIADSDLAVAPVIDGKILRLVIPALTRERREELAKIVKKVTEDGRVAVRSIRREANEKVERLEKEKQITEDERFQFQDNVQKLTDRYIQSADQAQSAKEKELIQG
ncbi:MAG: ribosome recycling factor [Candidatus Omnitrophica bacterium]|nr:ribosome recycling factor [Candidatus Omnitrophota bacterium]